MTEARAADPDAPAAAPGPAEAPAPAVERRPVRVLVVCTANSARSILAEAVLRHLGGPSFEVHSAGTNPSVVNPLSLRVLAEAGIPTAGLRSKTLDSFAGQAFDAVITVCDSARDACPVFPGGGRRLHWSLEDPAAVPGEEARLAAFRATLDDLRGRVAGFVADVRSAPARP